ncbi:hypothetical protein [Amycolatopsis sp. NPDC004079]|uniref:hypothetical protein n=1 Tax=Amycolatopsis sp. NPDC004079 TaxID=3154549 RepID=UPI0033A89D77
MNSSTHRPAEACPVRKWPITNPSAPRRPEIPVEQVSRDLPPEPLPYRLSCNRVVPLSVKFVLAAAVLAVPTVPGYGVSVLMHWLGAEDWTPQLSSAAVRVVAALVMIALLTRPLRWCIWQIRAGRARSASRRSLLAARNARDQRRAWCEQHQLERDQLPRGPVRAAADRLAGAVAAVESSRACRDGWIDDDQVRALRARQWSTLTRERDSVAVRAQLAEAARLDEHDPGLADIARSRAEEIVALDDELAALVEEAELLRNLVQDVDEKLAAADEKRALRERAADLARRLGSAPLSAEDADAWHRRLRDQVLAESGPADDLSILAAQLRAIARHLARDTTAAQVE